MTAGELQCCLQIQIEHTLKRQPQKFQCGEDWKKCF